MCKCQQMRSYFPKYKTDYTSPYNMKFTDLPGRVVADPRRLLLSSKLAWSTKSSRSAKNKRSCLKTSKQKQNKTTKEIQDSFIPILNGSKSKPFWFLFQGK